MIQGVGLGLRWEFVEELLLAEPSIDFLEVAPENYIGRGGSYAEALGRVVERWPVVTHGLAMSLGGYDALDVTLMRRVAEFVERVRSPWHSDHLCFSSYGGVVLHDLLPVSFKEQEVTRIAERIQTLRDTLKVPVAIENISFYVHPGKAEMSESEFVARVCDAADCGLLFDVNNAWVNAANFGWDIGRWFRDIPFERIVQIHVAGHDWFDGKSLEPCARPPESKRGDALIVDTHGSACAEEVLAFLGDVLRKTGPVPVLLERDHAIPPLNVLLEELRTIKELWLQSTSAGGGS